ncbi:MAG TPA: hypothetical protein VFI73_00855 [Candidatus Nitrosopolaris sp.]|nr:hypothetical protein [Candidatus Nitrosopolaris sp.]
MLRSPDPHHANMWGSSCISIFRFETVNYKVNVKLIEIYLVMSDFPFIRLMSDNMLTEEEKGRKEVIIQLTEEILHAKGIQGDASISKILEEEMIDILEKVRELRNRKKKKQLHNEVLKEVYMHSR